ncbi:MAG: YfhO family protein [Gemmatimonadota bacterium]|nr:YfhO family protein [Gemmatimonadota bacterium]
MPWEPRWPRIAALGICILAALTLLWPLLTGQILFGGGRSDMFIAGYSFRLFGAEEFRATGAIPQWNPYLFGGLPFIGAMHGDIFYPTAWLRWIMPVDLAITWGMALHFVLAGWLTFGFARALRLSWTAAITAGVAYELTGIVASQMSPGHDGKLFVSALTPLAFWLLLKAIRGGQRWVFGAFSLVVALLVLGHFQMCYFLLLALGMWAIYLAVADPERPPGQNPWATLALAAVAVTLGIGITALQGLPFLQYVPFSPRATGGPNTGWEWVNAYAFPPEEIFTTLLPQFNGVLDHYWGRNPIKFHTEYLGVIPVVLACCGVGARGQRRLTLALLVGAVVFLLFAAAGHTPFYRIWFEFMPMMKKMRAVGMVFFLVAFPVAILAGFGLDRLLTGEITVRRLLFLTGGLAVFALLGIAGVLQSVAELLVIPQRMEQAALNAEPLRAGAVRLLLFVVLAGGAFWAIGVGKVRGAATAAVLLTVMSADLWSIDRLFYTFSPRAAELFRDDPVTAALRQVIPPYRVFDAGGSYPASTLMAYRIPVAVGYHGNELQAYDQLAGKDRGYASLQTPALLDLLALRFLILPDTMTLPGWHRVVATERNTFGNPAVLYEQDSIPAYVRVFGVAAKVPTDQVIPTLLDPRFPHAQVLLYPDSVSFELPALRPPVHLTTLHATVQQWAPGAIRIAIAGRDSAITHLLVSENWYPDWRATVDGKPAQVYQANGSLIGVPLAPGASEVVLRFESAGYRLGKRVSLIALLLTLGLAAVPFWLQRRAQR